MIQGRPPGRGQLVRGMRRGWLRTRLDPFPAPLGPILPNPPISVKGLPTCDEIRPVVQRANPVGSLGAGLDVFRVRGGSIDPPGRSSVQSELACPVRASGIVGRLLGIRRARCSFRCVEEDSGLQDAERDDARGDARGRGCPTRREGVAPEHRLPAYRGGSGDRLEAPCSLGLRLRGAGQREGFTGSGGDPGLAGGAQAGRATLFSRLVLDFGGPNAKPEMSRLKSGRSVVLMHRTNPDQTWAWWAEKEDLLIALDRPETASGYGLQGALKARPEP